MLRLHMATAVSPKFAEMKTGDKTEQRNEGFCRKKSLFVMVFQNIKHFLKNAHLVLGIFFPTLRSPSCEGLYALAAGWQEGWRGD